MTSVSQKEFLNKLLKVVNKLAVIANTQGSRFKKLWDDTLKTLNDKPHLVRKITLDKSKFIKEIEYRIKVLKNVEQAFVDGFYSIRSLLETLYSSYLNSGSKLFEKNYSKADQIILKYYIARAILGNLVQYNTMEHETVPLKYNIIARNYLLIKLSSQSDSEILENMKKLQIKNLTLGKIRKLMIEIESDGIISKTKKGKKFLYELKKELILSKKGQEYYNKTLYPLVEWPTQIWRSFYNIRELNVTIKEDIPHRDFLHKILKKSATQGFSAADFVFKNLVKYYQEFQE